MRTSYLKQYYRFHILQKRGHCGISRNCSKYDMLLSAIILLYRCVRCKKKISSKTLYDLTIKILSSLATSSFILYVISHLKSNRYSVCLGLDTINGFWIAACCFERNRLNYLGNTLIYLDYGARNFSKEQIERYFKTNRIQDTYENAYEFLDDSRN